MNGMGSVERILVVGILVVVVAILGIASWNADGSDNVLPVAATDGGDGDGEAPLAIQGAEPAVLQKLKQKRAEQDARRAERNRQLNRFNVPVETPSAGAAGAGLAEVTTPEEIRRRQGAAGLPTDSLPLRQNGVSPPPNRAQEQPPAQTQPQTQPRAQVEAPDPPAAKSVPRDIEYVVQAGDNLWKIVNRHYGDGDVQRQLDLVLEANPLVDPDYIQVGQTLVLPKVMSQGVITPTPEQKAEDGEYDLYEVLPGDTLGGIAEALLGAESRWQEIYELNRDRISDPRTMQAGKTLLIPKK